MRFADLQRPVLSAIALGAALCLAPASAFAKAGGPSFSELTSANKLSLAAQGSIKAESTSNFITVFDVGGIFSNGEEGDATNEVFLLDIGPSSRVVGIGWDVTIFADSPSWLSEMVVSLGTSSGPPGDLYLTPSTVEAPGTASYSSGGIVDLIGLGLDFEVGADGQLRLEFLEDFDDFVADWDGIWQSGTLSIEVSPIPEPSTYGLMALGLLGVAAAARRRKA